MPAMKHLVASISQAMQLQSRQQHGTGPAHFTGRADAHRHDFLLLAGVGRLHGRHGAAFGRFGLQRGNAARNRRRGRRCSGRRSRRHAGRRIHRRRRIRAHHHGAVQHRNVFIVVGVDAERFERRYAPLGLRLGLGRGQSLPRRWRGALRLDSGCYFAQLCIARSLR